MSMNSLVYCHYFNVLCTYPYRLLLYKYIRLMTHLSGGNVGFSWSFGRSVWAQLTVVLGMQFKYGSSGHKPKFNIYLYLTL